MGGIDVSETFLVLHSVLLDAVLCVNRLCKQDVLLQNFQI